MYRWEIDDVAQPSFDALPPDGKRVLREFMDAAVIADPMEFMRNPDSKERNLRTLVFGPHEEGMIVFLVYVEDDLVLVVQITWIEQ